MLHLVYEFSETLTIITDREPWNTALGVRLGVDAPAMEDM